MDAVPPLAGVEGGWEAAPSSSGVLRPLVVAAAAAAVRRPVRGLGGTPAAAVLGFRPTRGLEGTPPDSEGLACPRRLWRAGLGGVLVATVRWRVLGLPGTVWTPMMFTWEPSGDAVLLLRTPEGEKNQEMSLASLHRCADAAAHPSAPWTGLLEETGAPYDCALESPKP